MSSYRNSHEFTWTARPILESPRGLLEKFRSKTEKSDDGFAKRQAALMEISRRPRGARGGAQGSGGARVSEISASCDESEEEEAHGARSGAKGGARRALRLRKKRKKGMRYARPAADKARFRGSRMGSASLRQIYGRHVDSVVSPRRRFVNSTVSSSVDMVLTPRARPFCSEHCRSGRPERSGWRPDAAAITGFAGGTPAQGGLGRSPRPGRRWWDGLADTRRHGSGIVDVLAEDVPATIWEGPRHAQDAQLGDCRRGLNHMVVAVEDAREHRP